LPEVSSMEPAAIGAPLGRPEIASAFFGCWEGAPGKFDSVVSEPQVKSLIRLDQVAICYSPRGAQIVEFDLDLTPTHRIFARILEFLSLGYHRSRVSWVKTELYKVTSTQIYERSTLLLELTESSLFKLPRTSRHTIVDEELATLARPGSVSVVGRTF